MQMLQNIPFIASVTAQGPSVAPTCPSLFSITYLFFYSSQQSYNVSTMIFPGLQMEKELENREGVEKEDDKNEEEIKTLGFKAFGILKL